MVPIFACCVCGKGNESKNRLKRLTTNSEEFTFLHKHCGSNIGEVFMLCQNCRRKIQTLIRKINEIVSFHHKTMLRLDRKIKLSIVLLRESLPCKVTSNIAGNDGLVNKTITSFENADVNLNNSNSDERALNNEDGSGMRMLLIDKNNNCFGELPSFALLATLTSHRSVLFCMQAISSFQHFKL